MIGLGLREKWWRASFGSDSSGCTAQVMRKGHTGSQRATRHSRFVLCDHRMFVNGRFTSAQCQQASHWPHELQLLWHSALISAGKPSACAAELGMVKQMAKLRNLGCPGQLFKCHARAVTSSALVLGHQCVRARCLPSRAITCLQPASTQLQAASVLPVQNR